MADDARAYLRRIARIPLLSARDEQRLARRGDADARRQLIEANLRLVVHLARPLVGDRHPLSLMDLVQEGTIGLVRAVERFDPRRGVRFATYAAWWIRSAMLEALRRHGGAAWLEAELSDAVADDRAPAPPDEAARAALRAPLHAALNELPPAQRRVVELRFGLTGEGPLTAREVARRLRTSAEKVRHAEDLALRRLRAHPSVGALGDAA
jgi:RNA polymerase sigma factor (sigma-70 family)